MGAGRVRGRDPFPCAPSTTKEGHQTARNKSAGWDGRDRAGPAPATVIHRELVGGPGRPAFAEGPKGPSRADRTGPLREGTRKVREAGRAQGDAPFVRIALPGSRGASRSHDHTWVQGAGPDHRRGRRAAMCGASLGSLGLLLLAPPSSYAWTKEQCWQNWRASARSRPRMRGSTRSRLSKQDPVQSAVLFRAFKTFPGRGLGGPQRNLLGTRRPSNGLRMRRRKGDLSARALGPEGPPAEGRIAEWFSGRDEKTAPHR